MITYIKQIIKQIKQMNILVKEKKKCCTAPLALPR